MSTTCLTAASEKLTLYYYGELAGDERREVEAHLTTCPSCAAVLSELETVRTALAPRGVVTRTQGDWQGFMRRLEAGLNSAQGAEDLVGRPSHEGREEVVRLRRRTSRVSPRAWLPLALAGALILAVALGLEWQRRTLGPVHTLVGDAAASDAALAAAATRHFERAKLVVLGLAMKDPVHTTAGDWEYERQLATSLLPETRLVRLSAMDRGDARLASLLGDLESVLLQASMASDADPPELQRIQRVIKRRDLLVRMDLREL